MPLDLIVDSLDSVPEPLRAAYVPDGDKFKLDAPIEDTAGLRSALKKERETRSALEKSVKKWEALGKSDEEIAALLSEQEKTAHENAKKKGDFDSILKQHTDKWSAEKATLAAERDEARNFGHNAVRSSGVQGALAKAKATPEGLDLLVERLGRRVTVEIEGGKAKTQIMQADGVTPMAGTGADGVATFDDLVKEAIKQYPSLFEGTGAGGGGKSSREGGGAAGKTMTRSEFDALDPASKADKMRKGFKVTD